MTVITYGKSTFAGNAKTRRHERRRKLAIERDTICNIIDSIFGCDVHDASQEVKSHRVDRVTKAVSRAGNKVKQQEVERKQNRIYYSKPGERGITCSGRQKIKGKSIPLI
ncbi:hypothetical protein GAI15_01180 [Salmonella enterica subsp. enterica serovar Newport]|nr:hypothetical protein [Salmonella enterica subsp. enterica]EBQ9324593.1 hypothetical protein [Salmonella enterica subsp. enterica serovar Newport]EBV4107288.1 hypothetical protein [Salmonella enterica subsp. enterica serovar Glostrup]ECC2069260.1 hypothetical protein [Salmonella enterica]ECG6536177.1 hypothetical protein [Salmonella enterica subsp. enterica serovar Frintrop]ECM3600816.1 hypothetical protein [Salmonella enterica subsp. enterica serovar Senftenberg]EHW1126934.1 hypothetical p